MKKLFFVLSIFVFVLTPVFGADDPWKPFAFMMGEWTGSGSGKPGEGTGEFSLKEDLGGKILIRRNHNEYSPKAGQQKGTAHDDLMIIYPPQGGGSYQADYFDSEGHVIHYTVSFPAGKVVLVSDGSAGPRFRLAYSKKSDSSLGIDFEVAPPGQDFRPYLSGTVARK